LSANEFDTAKLLSHFPQVNKVMTACFSPPDPARTAGVTPALAEGAGVEVDAVMVLE